jgi:hypothetical protein
VKSLPEVFTQLNQNFVALALMGMLKMLHGSGCHHLPILHSLAASSGASMLEDSPRMWRNLPDGLCASGGITTVSQRLSAD